MDTLITFVRHGKNNFSKAESPWHPGPRLNKQGKEQAEKTGKFLSQFVFDSILSSDMNRARQTAEIIHKYHIKNNFFENITFYRELAEHDETIYCPCPKSRVKFREELLKAEVTVGFFKRVLKENKGKKILIASHGNAIRACIGTSLGFPLRQCPELNLLNCSLSSLAFEGTKLKSIFYINSVGHCRKISFKKKFVSVQFISDYSVAAGAKKEKCKKICGIDSNRLI